MHVNISFIFLVLRAHWITLGLKLPLSRPSFLLLILQKSLRKWILGMSGKPESKTY